LDMVMYEPFVEIKLMWLFHD